MDKTPPTISTIEHLKTLLQQTTDPSRLETIGKNLIAQDLQELIDILPSTYTEKLPPLLVGLTPPVFLQLLIDIDARKLEDLKKLAATEGLQHHLTILGHDIELRSSKLEKTLLDDMHKVFTLRLTEFGEENLHFFLANMQSLTLEAQKLLSLIRKALTLVWNTTRLDLIKTFSREKENLEHFLLHTLGKPKNSSSSHATGMYAKFDAHLFNIFNGENLSEHLKDDEPAREGLTRVSVWYLKDYIDLGLQVNEQISRAPSLAEEAQNYAQIEIQLAKLGLKTVADLKSFYIVSKKRLAEHIKQTQKI